MTDFLDRPFRVVDITQWYSPVSGGIRTYLRAKADWAARAGAAHAAIVTAEHPGTELVGRSPFVAVRGLTPTDKWGYRLAPRPGDVVAALRALRPDVIILHDALAFPMSVARWAREAGVPLALFCHSDLALGAAGLPRSLGAACGSGLRFLQRRALAAVDVVMSASSTTARAIADDAAAPIVRSGLGIDLADMVGAQPDPALRRELTPGGGPLIVHAGRLTSDKRVDLLVPTLAHLDDDTVMAIAGQGPMRAKLERRAERMGVASRLSFMGHVHERSRLASVFATADCFVHPNPSEPYGLTPLEALAAGCRVVAPWTGGTGETLRDRGAVLVAPDDPAALADGIREALRRPAPRPDLSSVSWDATFTREWRLYAELHRGEPREPARTAGG